MTTWKLDTTGGVGITTYADGKIESRIVSQIPADDATIPADPPTSTEQRAIIANQIAEMERQQLLPRVTREGLLNAFVVLAAGQGVTEPELYASNIAYKKTKDFDAEIIALRTQMEAII